MQSPHHPLVSRRNDGRWVLNCPECQLDSCNRPRADRDRLTRRIRVQSPRGPRRTTSGLPAGSGRSKQPSLRTANRTWRGAELGRPSRRSGAVSRQIVSPTMCCEDVHDCERQDRGRVCFAGRARLDVESEWARQRGTL